MFKYIIDGKTYIQKPLVLGQIRQLIGHLKGLEIKPGSSGVGIVFELGDQLPAALAIVLVEEGKSPKREMEEIKQFSEELEYLIDGDTTVMVVEDFFVCNPISSILERIGRLKKFLTAKNPTGSKNPSSSSPEEISPKETPSSGDTLPENVSPG